MQDGVVVVFGRPPDRQGQDLENGQLEVAGHEVDCLSRVLKGKKGIKDFKRKKGNWLRGIIMQVLCLLAQVQNRVLCRVVAKPVIKIGFLRLDKSFRSIDRYCEVKLPKDNLSIVRSISILSKSKRTNFYYYYYYKVLFIYNMEILQIFNKITIKY